MAGMSDRLGKCEVCDDDDAKYTCPKCEVKTCCLRCVNIHKQELQCDGVRNKVAFKSISTFTNLDLLSDYRLLEEVTRSVDSYVRDPLKNYTRQFKDLPVHLYKLRAAATKRGTRLLFLPANFSRHKENTTYLNWKTQVISWRIEWVFSQSDIKHIDNRIEESCRLTELLDRHVDPAQCPRLLKEPLQFYQSAGHSGISLLLKGENIRKANSRFHLLDPSMTLRQALKGKAVVEFPTIYVILNNHKDAYEIVNSDEEEEEEDSLLEKKRSGPLVHKLCRKQLTRTEKRKGNNLLFHNSDYSSEGSDIDDSSKVAKNSRITAVNSSSPINEIHEKNIKAVKQDVTVLYNEVQSEGKLPSASKLLNGIGQLNVPPYDVLIKLPQ
ncbi:box C/D snoRNA protein 1 [Anabrus simplex]|uniref:box C/D snoRNA protein 1 n=1 Tax=Anabrus simplex TaxID=316456 RepID=UPI0035A3059B